MMSSFSFSADEEQSFVDCLFTMMMGMTPEQWDALGDENDAPELAAL